MTLLVGIKCQHAVVLASDGAATYGSGLGGQTVRQDTKKVLIIDDRAAIATSGPVGIGQRLSGEFQAMLTNGDQPLKAMESWQVMAFLRQKFAPTLLSELQYAAQAQALIGSAARQSALSFTLAAMMVAGDPCLFQFDQQGAPEEQTDTLPWVTAGSGQGSADAFLAFLRRVLWPGRVPTLQEGVFTALWTVLQGINTAPGFVGGDPQVVVVDGNGARELSKDDLQEHRESIAAAEAALAGYKSRLQDADTVVSVPKMGEDA